MVGGGVIGLSASFELARAGARVTLFDPSPGRGASWVAAGMLAPVTEAAYGEERLVRLLLEALARWPAFSQRLEEASGLPSGYSTGGTLVVALDASDQVALERMVDFQRSLGLSVSPLSARECRSLCPSLSPQVRGGVDVPGEQRVDNRQLVAALMAACSNAGVETVRRRVVSVDRTGDGAACGVLDAEGEHIAAATVLLAAGVQTPFLGGLPDGVIPPVRPVKGHVLRLKGPSPPVLDHSVRGIVHGRHCYLVPRADGSVALGATSEERGYDLSVQAGAVHALLDDARLLVPALDEWELVECIAGLRPALPDNCPCVGESAVPGLVLACGHYRNGILLTPITAESVSALWSTGSVDPAFLDFGAASAASAAGR